MKVFDSEYLSKLSADAKRNCRRRQHQNLHSTYEEPFQRLFNAIEPESYIRPHRHCSDSKDELLIAIRGLMALLIFDDDGRVLQIVYFGVDSVADSGVDSVAAGVEVPPKIWHTVIALEPGSVLFEGKCGPFDLCHPKDLAPWAPAEATDSAMEYLNELKKKLNRRSLP